jgi:hypothetical protein
MKPNVKKPTYSFSEAINFIEMFEKDLNFLGEFNDLLMMEYKRYSNKELLIIGKLINSKLDILFWA